MKKKRAGMKIKQNTGQWHEDVDRVHTYKTGQWVIVFTDVRGYYDSDLGINVTAEIPVKIMATKSAVLKTGLAAFIGKGEKAHLIMRNVAI